MAIAYPTGGVASATLPEFTSMELDADEPVAFTMGAGADDFVTLDTQDNRIVAHQKLVLKDNVSGGDDIIAIGVVSNEEGPSAALTGATEAATNFSLSKLIQAGTLRPGVTLWVHFAGIHTVSTDADQHAIRLKWGTVILAQVASINPGDNDVFVCDAFISCRTAGATGTVVVSGTLSIGARAGSQSNFNFASGATEVSTQEIDTTLDTTLAVEIQRGATDDVDSTTLDQFFVVVLPAVP